jgi:DNA-directed RNA polymerase specialized sigma24 family protein
MTMKPISLSTTTLATFASIPAPTGNDNSTPKRLPVHPAKLLADPEVVRSIEGKLLRLGVDRQDLADGVAEVQKRALENIRKSPMPTDVGRWKALSCTIAERMVLKDRLRDEKRGRYNTGLCEDPEEYAPLPRSPGRGRDPVDMSRQIAVLKAQFDAAEMPEQGQEILMGVMDGLSAREIGEEIGLTETAVANRLSRMRRLFKAKLASLGMLVLMLLVAVLFSAPFGGMATRDTDPPPLPPPIVARTVAPHDHATTLLRADEDGGSDAQQLLDEQDRELEAKPRP